MFDNRYFVAIIDNMNAELLYRFREEYSDGALMEVVVWLVPKGSRNNNSLFWDADPSRLAGRFMFLTEPAFPTSLWVTLRKLER